MSIKRKSYNLYRVYLDSVPNERYIGVYKKISVLLCTTTSRKIVCNYLLCFPGSYSTHELIK